LRKHSLPLWIRLLEKLHLDLFVNWFRRDTKHVPPGQRMSNIEALAYWSALRRLRRKAYNSEALLPRALFAVEDLNFNAILIRANSRLKEIAKVAGHELPSELQEAIDRGETALEQLWDEAAGQYFSRSFVGHKLIEESSIATLLPLYAGTLTHERVARLVDLLKRQRMFSASWPVPSVPVNSPYFNPYKYWQGPSWVNTNWLIINGLKNYGYDAEAAVLKERTLKMVAKSGMYEYFNPQNAKGAGAADFSWTAALTIDLLAA
jgi:neutral trehalase